MRTLLLLFLLMASTSCPGQASVRDVSADTSAASSSPSSSSDTSGKQAAANVSGHPNLVTYPQSQTRKAKLDDSPSDDVMQSQGSRYPTHGPSDHSNDEDKSQNSVPSAVAKAATDSMHASLPSIINNKTSKQFCDRPKRPHSGLVIKPLRKLYPIHMTIIMQCHNGLSISATCDEGGYWSRGAPHCPATNQSCPDIELANGNVTYVGSTSKTVHPLRTKASFKCNEGFELVGAPAVVCDTGFRWSYRPGVCRPISPEKSGSSSSSLLTILMVAIGILFVLVIGISGSLYYYW